MEESKKNVLLIGGTGGVSLWVAHYLLKGNYNVSILIRNLTKLKTTFKEKANQFKNIFVDDVADIVT